MRRASLEGDSSRELLARIIMEAIQEWPELDRRVFVSAHYGGQSSDHVARTCGVTRGEVHTTLRRCECRLYDALRGFRRPTHFDSDSRPAAPVSCILSTCAR